MDAGGNANDWRAALATESRTKIVKRIVETLQRLMPVAGQEGMNELHNTAWRFEQKIFQAATDQQDYLRKISLKMLSLETRAQNPADSGMSGAMGQSGDSDANKEPWTQRSTSYSSAKL